MFELVKHAKSMIELLFEAMLLEVAKQQKARCLCFFLPFLIFSSYRLITYLEQSHLMAFTMKLQPFLNPNLH